MIKKSVLKIMTLMLVAVFAVSTMTWFSGTSSLAAKGPLLSKPIKVSYGYCMGSDVKPVNLNEPWYKEFTKKTNVTITKIIAITTPYTEKYAVLVSSGDLPDFLMISQVPVSDILTKFGKTGNLVNFKQYYKDMPNMIKRDKRFQSEINVNVTDKEGNMYVTPSIYDMKWIDTSPSYRKDIFVKNGIKPPRSKDEFYAVCKKLKSLYPDSFPLSTYNKGIGELNSWANYMFNASTSAQFNASTKKWVYGPAQPAYKEAVQFWNKLYKEKLLDPEFISNAGADTWTPKISTEKTFMCYFYIGTNSRINKSVKPTNSDFVQSSFAPPTKDGSKTKYVPGFSVYPQGMAISSKTKYKNELVKLVDWFYTDEGAAMTNMGLEGKTYVKDTDPKALFPYKFMPQVAVYDNPSGKTMQDLIKSPSYQNTCSMAILYPQLMFYTIWGSKETYNDEQAVLKDCIVTERKLDPVFTKAENDEKAKLMGSLGTHLEENVTNFITGKKPMSEWSSFVAKQKELGYVRLMEIWNKAEARK